MLSLYKKYNITVFDSLTTILNVKIFYKYKIKIIVRNLENNGND